MSLSTGRARMMGALKELHGRWERVEKVWDDPVRKRFEETYVKPLDTKARATVAAIEHMEEIVTKVRRDCG